MSWYEFNCAVGGYFDHVRLMLGIEQNKELPVPTDDERQQTKQKREKWIRFFKRPTLKTTPWQT